MRERLDRAFGSDSWWRLFPLCKLTVHQCVYSDHNPILVELYSVDHSKKQFRFRFENTWLKEEKFHEDVITYWKGLQPIHFLPKLIELSLFMEKWGRQFFNKFREKIRKQKELVALYEDCADDNRTSCYFAEKKNLEDLMVSEELYWQQRAKSFWLQDGDSNTKYFHACASSRKRRNQVGYLKDESGTVVSKQEEMCEVVEKYFRKNFSDEGRATRESMDDMEAVITESQNAKLTSEFTFKEFSTAIKQMHPDKSAGPDGLNPAFYQHFWHLIR